MAVSVKGLKRTGKGTPPTPTVPTNHNLKTLRGKNVPLQLNIAPELRREFRIYAAEREMDMSILFATIWQHYKETAQG